MREGPGLMFGEVPSGPGRPKSAQFLPCKSRLHADPGIVTGDGMATDPAEAARRPPGGTAAAGFGRREAGGSSGQGRKQTRDPLVFQMVKKEICQDSLHGWAFLCPLKNISRHDGGKPVAATKVSQSRLRDDGLSIDEKDPGAVSAFRVGPKKYRAEQGTIAGTQIREGGRRPHGKILRKPAGPEADLAEPGMKTAEIAAAGLGGRIVGRKGIEKFGGKDAGLHRRTSRNAPKLEKPAPKEASHQSPSGTPFRRA